MPQNAPHFEAPSPLERVRELPDAEKPAVLKAYLDRFKLTVQRYFPVRAGSPAADFVTLAPRYPVFELIPTARPSQGI